MGSGLERKFRIMAVNESLIIYKTKKQPLSEYMVVEWITGNEDITNRFRERGLEIVSTTKRRNRDQICTRTLYTLLYS